MFIKAISRSFKNGNIHHYASLVENKKVNGKVVQTTVAYIGAVEEDQIPYLKAAWTPEDERPELVFRDQNK